MVPAVYDNSKTDPVFLIWLNKRLQVWKGKSFQ